MGKATARASVHAVVETALMGGDLVPGASASRLLEGVRGHRSLQSVEQEGVRNEVPVRLTVEGERVALTVYGRIDRLYGLDTVEEIKTTLDRSPEDAAPLHWAQAECYGHMLCQAENLPALNVRVTYLNLTDGDLTRFTRTYTREALAEKFAGYVRPYLAHLDALTLHRASLGEQMRRLPFPFPTYREGQRELAQEIFLAIRDKRMVMAQAPTGIGKTLAALFPALKGFGQGLAERVFYLTARSTTREAALSALRLMGESDLRAVVLYAREKCCAQGTPLCRSGLCERALGYYDRLPEAIQAALDQGGPFDRDVVRALADRFCLCPFELALDLSLECDVIICDYNYLFDPRVRLQRYASGGRQGQVLLIDEAHNLPDRARDMYSAQLSQRAVDHLRASIPKPRRKEPLYRALRALSKEMEEAALCGETPRVEQDLRPDLILRCEEALCALRESDAAQPEEAAALSLDLTAMVYFASHYDQNYNLLIEGGKRARTIALMCLDASEKTGAVLRRSRAAVLFSATLTPMAFYRALCGVKEGSPCVTLRSPFPRENLMVLNLPVSTRYRAREGTLPRVVSALMALVSSREKGNFIAFFPSYAYLKMALERLAECLPEGTQLLAQSAGMGEEERQGFLARFEPHPSGRLLGLCVLGGVFAEGIDLAADRLCGAAVVGVGLPQVGAERDALAARYQAAYGDGYAYAYTYPGLGKVLQAAGRLIRSQSDRGVLLLIDDRYGQERYAALLPPHWTVRRVWNDGQITRLCADFFGA